MRVEGQGSNWLHRPTRLALYARDDWRCVYCGRKVYTGKGKPLASSRWAATLDHVLSQELGGATEARNLVTCCCVCNSIKGCKPLAVFVRDLKLFHRRTYKPGVAGRIRAALRKPLDRAEGQRLFLKGL